MLQNKIINMALSTADPLISTDRSRCVRMRFNKNNCSICTASCSTGAISIAGGITIDAAKCTGCMLCVSECPSGCFSALGDDFTVLLAKLSKAQNSVPACVLGCQSARDTEAHVKTCCLGFLSEEHLIALTVYLDKPLYLNLTACGECRNSYIVERLKERIHNARIKASLDVGAKIIAAENKAAIVFEDISLDRRGFFQALKTMTFTQVAGLLDENDADKPVSYSAKRIPLKRELLNTAIRKLSDGKPTTAMLSNYAFTVQAGPSCTNCSACVGMCPTGALKVKKDADGAGILFNSSLCNGCALCRDFCREGAAYVSKGFCGDGYFEHDICKSDSCKSYPASEHNADIAY